MPALKVCTVPGCPELVTSGRCVQHRSEADKARGTATQRGYTSRGHRTFRAAVLNKHPVCVICTQALSTVADHHPLSRRNLLRTGADPNDPQHGRGLCATCHNRETARHQPGGFVTQRDTQGGDPLQH